MRPDPAVELRSLPAGISVVIPCYNSEATVSDLTRRLAQVLPTLAAPFELILVNDGSTDGTWAAIEAVTREFSWVRGLDLMRNYGQHNATLCGARAALYDVTVTLDDDLQNPPEEIAHLIEKAAEGFDLVCGRFRHKQHASYRRLGSVIIGAINERIFGKPKDFWATNFRLIHRSVVERVCAYRTAYPYINGLTAPASSC